MYGDMKEYLRDVERYLKPLSADDRQDIVKEIESNAIELQRDRNLSFSELLERLGTPKDLARAYLGDMIANEQGHGIRKVCQIIAFYTVAGLAGMIILPFTGLLSVTLFVCSIIVPLAGIVKWVGALCGYDIPNIMVQIGDYLATPFQTFLFSIVSAVICWILGKVLWKIMIAYIKGVVAKSPKSI